MEGAGGGVALVGTLGGEQMNAACAEELQKKPSGDALIDTHLHVAPARLPGLKPISKDVEQLYGGPPRPWHAASGRRWNKHRSRSL